METYITLNRFDAAVVSKLLGVSAIRLLVFNKKRVLSNGNIHIVIHDECTVMIVNFFVDCGYDFKPSRHTETCYEYWFIQRPDIIQVATEVPK